MPHISGTCFPYKIFLVFFSIAGGEFLSGRGCQLEYSYTHKNSLLSNSILTSITLLADFPKVKYVKCQPCVIFGPVRILERHSSCFFIILLGRDKGKSGYLRFIIKVPLYYQPETGKQHRTMFGPNTQNLLLLPLAAEGGRNEIKKELGVKFFFHWDYLFT